MLCCVVAVSCHATMCCVVLWWVLCAVSCHATLCCVVLWCVLCRAMLRCAVMCCAVSCHAMLCCVVVCAVCCVVPCYVVLYCVILWFGVVLRRVVVWCLKVIPSKYNLHSDFGKSLSICNSLYVYPRNEIKKGGPHTLLIEIWGQKSTPLGLYFC